MASLFQRSRPVATTGTGMATAGTITDPTTGVQHLVDQKFWRGGPYRCLGAGTKVRQIAFLAVKVYSAALYVEADPAGRELAAPGGDDDEAVCSALLAGAFTKVLVLHLVRTVTAKQFNDAINEVLGASMQEQGAGGHLEAFNSFIRGSRLTQGSEVVLLWGPEGDLEVLVRPPEAEGRPTLYGESQPSLRIPSPVLSRAVFQNYLGHLAGNPPAVPEARAAWAQAARGLAAAPRGA